MFGRRAKQPSRRTFARPATVPTEGLVARNLRKSFKRRPVTRDVSVSVRRGEAVGLLGPNGAGKTTVFYMITGLIAADSGTISLDGEDITDLPMYQRARLGIGYLPQEASVFRALTVEDNIRAVLELHVPNRTERERKLRGLLDEFQITHIKNSPAVALSGGERRRVEIARALPQILDSSCSTNPSQGLIPLRSMIFANWCDSSPLGDSGCLLRITTSAKPSKSSIEPLSSMKATY